MYDPRIATVHKSTGPLIGLKSNNLYKRLQNKITLIIGYPMVIICSLFARIVESPKFAIKVAIIMVIARQLCKLIDFLHTSLYKYSENTAARAVIVDKHAIKTAVTINITP